MKKTWKSLTAVLAAVLLLTVMLPAKVSAAEEEAVDSVTLEELDRPAVGRYVPSYERYSYYVPRGANYEFLTDGDSNPYAVWYEYDASQENGFDYTKPLAGVRFEEDKEYVLEVVYRAARGFTMTPKTETPAAFGCEEVLGKQIDFDDPTIMTVWYKYGLAEEYDLRVTPETVDFGTVAPGYKVPEPKAFTVTNWGVETARLDTVNKMNEGLENYEIALVQDPSSEFIIADDEDIYIDPCCSKVFLIVPKADLPEGDYSMTLAVNGMEPLYSCCAYGLDEPGEPEEPEEPWNEVLTKADLAVSFKVETPKPETPAAPATGDSGSAQLWALLGLVSLCGVAFVVSRKNRVRG